jgi:hypothetical protein
MAFYKSPYSLMMLIFTYILIGNPDGLAGLSVPKIPVTKPVNQSSLQMALKFSLPSRGAPGTRSRKGAGVRENPSCPPLANPEEKLTALVPGTNLGLTVSERPTFWFYVPYSSNNRLAVEFSLQDKEGKSLYQQNFPLVGTPGIVSIRLPETVSPLEIGKLYHWRFTVICDPNNRLDDLTVEGGVERSLLTPELKSRLEKETPRERIAIYAENGFWYDALTNLVELRRTKPQDETLQQDWADLWREVRLESMVSKPIVPCCTQERSQP